MARRAGPKGGRVRARDGRRVARFVLVSLVLSISGGAAGADIPPWVGPGEPPLPAWVKSVRVLRDDEPLVTSPWASAPRRGSAARDARLPVFAAHLGAG